MKILVTGGTGFTGTALVKRLSKQGNLVRILARNSSDTSMFKNDKVVIQRGDIRDANSVRNAVAGMDYVYHLAAISRGGAITHKKYWEVNVEGTRNIMDACKEKTVRKILHCSTVDVLGSILKPPADETCPYNPLDYMQKTKCEGEKIALSYYQKYELPVVVVRPATIFGPGDMRLLKLFQLIAKKRFIMIGEGKTYAHLIYIDDLINGFELCIRKGTAGRIYNFAGTTYVTLNELVQIIAKELRVSLSTKLKLPVLPIYLLASVCETICAPLGLKPPIFKRRVDFYTKNRAFDISLSVKELGYRPGHDLTTEIHLTCEWYKQHGFL